MSIKNNILMMPLKRLRLARKTSESALAESAGVSRMTVRHVEAGDTNATVESLSRIVAALDGRMVLAFSREETPSECSTVAVSMKVLQCGFSSWKTHFMSLVDTFRRTLDPLLLALPPVRELDLKLQALLASIVIELCRESEMDAPPWALKSYFLEKPWFVSESESLRASALVESPLSFRKNNIFVLENFLERR